MSMQILVDVTTAALLSITVAAMQHQITRSGLGYMSAYLCVVLCCTPKLWVELSLAVSSSAQSLSSYMKYKSTFF
jgi:hypothetical protein